MEEAKPRNGNIEDTMEEARFAKDGTLLTPGTPEEEAAVIRKLDWRILPLVLLVYTFSNLDRSNLGNAKLAGLGDSVDLSGRRYDWLATAFYIACQPSIQFGPSSPPCSH